ncbi:hypothetical protein Z949_3764 [Sulfitobacter guttiformis KCTC 32187]|nr:hypothetical protein Z949_3764 [Sulfitobacter guttiformis KCTC 32187]
MIFQQTIVLRDIRGLALAHRGVEREATILGIPLFEIARSSNL